MCIQVFMQQCTQDLSNVCIPDFSLDTVSTTRDSGWVRSHAATLKLHFEV